MTQAKISDVSRIPPRWRKPAAATWLGWVAAAAFIIHGLAISELTPGRFLDAGHRLADFLSQAFPPNVERMPNILLAILETFEMAVVGTLAGAILSLPIAVLAARNTSPNRVVYFAARALISFVRSVPDLVWGLILIVAVGLGPGTGMLVIMIDVIGFCGRFFAEKIEEIPAGPVDALRMTGAGPVGVIVGAIVPASLPSMVATTLFSLEHSVRSAVVIGLVGAGGIGVELSTSMKLLQYDTALTIIMLIFAVVVLVERLSAAIRKRIL